jgi:hypothetical protein
MATDSKHADGIVISLYRHGELVSRPVLKWPNEADGYSQELFCAMLEVITKEIKDLAVVAGAESYDSRPATREEER